MRIFKEDIQKLIEIYIKLKEIMVILIELSERYAALKGFKEHIDNSIKILDEVDHQVKQEAWDLAIENKKENK